MKKYLFLILGLLLLSSNVKAETTTKEVEFVRCVDGDTAVFSEDGQEVKYRFLAIDTPETVHPTKSVEEFGKDASEYTCNKLTNASSIVVEVETSNKTDKYGRSLAWIWVDKSLLQKELVEAGYAEVAYIYGTYKYTESLCLTQQEAKEQENGIWSEANREEGYCSTIDTSQTLSNIAFPDGTDDTSTTSDKEVALLSKTGNAIEKVNDYLEAFINSSVFEKVAIVFVVIIGGIATIKKSKKHK